MDPNRAPWDQEYAPAKPVVPAGQQSTQADPPAQGDDGFDVPILGHQPSFTSFLRNAPTEAGLSGDVSRLSLGALQGILGPFEWAEKKLGIRDPPQAELVRKAAQTPEGELGQVGGALFNPVNRLVGAIAKPIEWAGDAAGELPAIGRAIRTASRVVRGAVSGGLGAATAQPDQRGKDITAGTVVGGLMGVPGAAASHLGFENVQQLASRLGRLPVVDKIIDALRSTGEGRFNTTWLNHALEPISGGSVTTAGFDAIHEVGRRIGGVIERATAGMSLPSSPAVLGAIQRSVSQAANSVLDSNARAAFSRTIDETVLAPLQRIGSLAGDEFTSVVSNLGARIREIPGRTDAQRELRSALEDFRMTLINNAQGGNQRLWRLARQAWSRFAPARDAARGTKDGVFSPDGLADKLEGRTPASTTVRPPDLRIANQAQQAMVSPARAATQAIRGQPLTQPQDWASRVAAALSSTGTGTGLPGQ